MTQAKSKQRAKGIKNRKLRAGTVGLCATLILACNALLPTPAPAPTSAWTVSPSNTSRPTRLPTRTPQPTHSPTPTVFLSSTPSDTPTPAPSETPTPSRELDCKLLWQSPGNGFQIASKTQFGVGWKISNTGRATWAPGSTVLAYVSGSRMNRDGLVQLPRSVAPGDSVILSAEMTAPKNSTKYTTFWSLRRGTEYFCPLSLTIYVP